LSGGTLSVSGSSSAYSVPWGTITSGQTVSSTPFNVFTNRESISVAVPSITIGGTTYTNRTATFSGISSGVDYTMNLIFLKDIVAGGVTWAPGNLIYSNGTYSFASTQEYYSGTWNGGDYFCWDTLDPTATSTTNSGSSWDATTDPCTKVSPAGTWRTPTSAELTALWNSGYVLGTKNGIKGYYFNTSTVPTTNVDSYVFLPTAGGRNASSTSMANVDGCGYYWSSAPSGTAKGFEFYFNSANSVFMADGDNGSSRSFGFSVRCVLQ